MSRAWARQRARLFAGDGPQEASSRPFSRSADPAKDFVARDFAPLRSRSRRDLRPWVAVALGALAAALMVASLRVSIVRLRYRLSAAVVEETDLLARQRAMTVELRELRDPSRLRALATQQGFAPPERVVQLSVPARGAGEAPR